MSHFLISAVARGERASDGWIYRRPPRSAGRAMRIDDMRNPLREHRAHTNKFFSYFSPFFIFLFCCAPLFEKRLLDRWSSAIFFFFVLYTERDQCAPEKFITWSAWCICPIYCAGLCGFKSLWWVNWLVSPKKKKLFFLVSFALHYICQYYVCHLCNEIKRGIFLIFGI